MEYWLWALLLKPFVAVVILTLVGLIARFIHRRMKDGELKDRLFTDIGP